MALRQMLVGVLERAGLRLELPRRVGEALVHGRHVDRARDLIGEGLEGEHVRGREDVGRRALEIQRAEDVVVEADRNDELRRSTRAFTIRYSGSAVTSGTNCVARERMQRPMTPTSDRPARRGRDELIDPAA